MWFSTKMNSIRKLYSRYTPFTIKLSMNFLFLLL
nr:MAG TPA: hypothetical protein [Caudoviricetes sp.]